MRIENLKLKIKNYREGYTLVELLVVMVVLIIIGTVMVAILVSALRGSNKSTAVNDVRQSGNTAISQMSKMITYAEEFKGVSSDGSTYITDCTVSVPPAPTPTPVPNSYTYLKIKSGGIETIFSCANNDITANDVSFINTDNISVLACNFTCSQTTSATAPIIGINFTLSKIGGGLVENNVTIPFQTSVVPRNY